MWDLIVSAPDHCLSIYFSFALQAGACLSFCLDVGSFTLKEGSYLSFCLDLRSFALKTGSCLAFWLDVCWYLIPFALKEGSFLSFYLDVHSLALKAESCLAFCLSARWCLISYFICFKGRILSLFLFVHFIVLCALIPFLLTWGLFQQIIFYIFKFSITKDYLLTST